MRSKYRAVSSEVPSKGGGSDGPAANGPVQRVG